MSNDDEGPTFNQIRNRQIRREVEAFERNSLAKAQAQLDGSQLFRDLQTIERAADRRGDYSPVRRFEQEADEAQQRADEEYQRRR
jgi:hypothetical protein